MAQNRLEHRLVLDLLDDQNPLKMNHFNWAPPKILPPTTPVAARTTTVATRSMGRPSAAAATAPAIQRPSKKEKIIRAQRTLRSMMSEYNRPSPTLFRNPVRKDGCGIQSERVEHIQLPEIPGKILRPE